MTIPDTETIRLAATQSPDGVSAEDFERWLIQHDSEVAAVHLADRLAQQPEPGEPSERVKNLAKALEEHGWMTDPDEGSVCECGASLAPAGEYGGDAYRMHVAQVAHDTVTAMPHLRRTIPNTVEALEGLGAGTIIRHVEGLLWVKIADHLWAEGPQEPAVRTGTVMLSASADSSWVVIWDGGMWEGDDE